VVHIVPATTRRSFLTGGRSPAAFRVAITDQCLPHRFIHCQSCMDACPEQAIRFTPRLGGPPLPRIDAARCSGCGDCVGACPVSALVLAGTAANG
jgi:ferredoxin-type protein NapF